MANLSNEQANLFRDFYFRTLASLTKPSTLAFALTHNPPSAGTFSNTTDELANAGGYVRQTVTPLDANFSVTSTSGQTFNNTVITFPQANADQGWASGVLITDNATYGTGKVIAWGTLTNPREIKSSDQYTIAVSGVNVQWS